MLRTKIKASSITNLTDARYFSAWDVEYIGFNIEEGTETYVALDKVKEMKAWLEGPSFIAELGSFPNPEEIKVELGFDAFQVGPFCSKDIVEQLSSNALPIMKELVWTQETTWEGLKEECKSLSPFVQYFLLDLNGYSLEGNDYEILSGFCSTYPTFLDVNIPPEKILGFLDLIHPYGLAIKGGEEEKVGYKSFDELDAFFENLEIFE